MPNAKLENLLNLALSATEAEMQKSHVLNTGYSAMTERIRRAGAIMSQATFASCRSCALFLLEVFIEIPSRFLYIKCGGKPPFRHMVLCIFQ